MEAQVAGREGEKVRGRPLIIRRRCLLDQWTGPTSRGGWFEGKALDALPPVMNQIGARPTATRYRPRRQLPSSNVPVERALLPPTFFFLLLL